MLTPNRAFVLAWCMLFALVFAMPAGRQALAQSCTADVQCPNFGRSRADCIGDTLIVRRSVCSGTCREIEERRENCDGGIGGRCVGGGYERITGRCNSSLGICERRADRELCVPSCTCRNNLLIVSTGACSAAIGCHRSVKRCPGGCSCEPEPRCIGGQ